MHANQVTRPATAACLLALLGSCTVVPPRGFPPSDEREVVVSYEFGDGAPAMVEVPASGPDITVLWLETQPGDVPESFLNGGRQLHPDGDSLTVRCRYRVYEQRDTHGNRLPLRRPEDLFPDASTIHTIRRQP